MMIETPSYPRPQFKRDLWKSLDGKWKFCFDSEAAWKDPNQIKSWPLEIEVPFAPESKRSGIGDRTYHRVIWYERDFQWTTRKDSRTLLHFGAVDYSAKVWLNGKFVGSHQGGHTPFTLDITTHLSESGTQTVSVRAEDDPLDLEKPRGKQDWQLEPHSIWYPRTSGIWQSVWIESVSDTYIDRIRWTPHLERWEIGFEAFITGKRRDGMTLKLKLQSHDQILVDDTYRVIIGEVHRRLALSDPGIDDFRNTLLWSPEKPTLIHAQIELWEGDVLLDRVQSYTALRSASIMRDRFMLNGRPYYLRFILDQGYWPDTFMTPPDDEALIKDIKLVKAMGFNGVRKHQKIEDPRFLYYADQLGLLVWEEMPSSYRFTHTSVERLIREWMEVMDRDFNHPCIVAWVPFNESWGVPDLVEKKAHQHCVQSMYYLSKTLDQTRPVIGNDGWETTTTDIIGIHDYDANPRSLLDRYGPHVDVTDMLGRKRPGGRVLTIDGYPHTGQPFVLTEFGGIAFVSHKQPEVKVNEAWGYSRAYSKKDFETRFTELLAAVNSLELFSGFCYTQLTDTFQEANGLLTMDRVPKVAVDLIRKAVTGQAGPTSPQEFEDSQRAMISSNDIQIIRTQ